MKYPNPHPAWQGPTCRMCHGTGVYPYRTASGLVWGVCGECFGHGNEAS